MNMLNNKVEEYTNDLINSIKRLVAIPSIEGNPVEGYPFGIYPTKALEEALNISKSLGFKTKNIKGAIGYAEYGIGNDYIGVLGHVDVVPEGSNWHTSPFNIEVKDKKIFGRGVLDNKGPIISALYALKVIKDLNLHLSKKVRIIFGTNEESGFNDIPYYLKEEDPPIMGFTPDCKYPPVYGERGILKINLIKKLNRQNGNLNLVSIEGDFRSNIVPDYVKLNFNIKDTSLLKNLEIKNNIKYQIINNNLIIESFGKSSPGNAPELGDNAIVNAFKYLSNLNGINEDLSIFFKFIVSTLYKNYYGKGLNINFEDSISGKLIVNLYNIYRDNFNIGVSLSIRYPITCSFDYIMDELKKFLPQYIDIKVLSNMNSVCFEKDSKLLKVLQKVYEDITGMDGTPVTTTGGTYAKVMPNIVAFGPSFPGQKGIAHNSNEYITIDDLILNTKIFANAIYELAK